MGGSLRERLGIRPEAFNLPSAESTVKAAHWTALGAGALALALTHHAHVHAHRIQRMSASLVRQGRGNVRADGMVWHTSLLDARRARDRQFHDRHPEVSARNPDSGSRRAMLRMGGGGWNPALHPRDTQGQFA